MTDEITKNYLLSALILAGCIALPLSAAEYVRQALTQPFTIHTSYAQAPGRSALVRYYAFVETHDGHDLAHLLIEQGLARVRTSSYSSMR